MNDLANEPFGPDDESLPDDERGAVALSLVRVLTEALLDRNLTQDLDDQHHIINYIEPYTVPPFSLEMSIALQANQPGQSVGLKEGN